MIILAGEHTVLKQKAGFCMRRCILISSWLQWWAWLPVLEWGRGSRRADAHGCGKEVGNAAHDGRQTGSSGHLEFPQRDAP